MGVSVLQIFPDSSRAGCQEIEKLHKRILHLNAAQAGLFAVDCDTYYTVSQTTPGPVGMSPLNSNRKMHILHNSDTPASTYAVLDTGTKQVTISADLLFDLLLPKMNHMYQSRKNLKIESKGTRFEVGDFVVKVGTVTMSGHYKGILVEVTYLPCSVPALCWSLLREFMQSFMGSCVSSQAPSYLQNHWQDSMSPSDAIQQYVEKFQELREGSGSSSGTTTAVTGTLIAP